MTQIAPLRFISCLLVLAALGGCSTLQGSSKKPAPEFTLDEADYVEAIYALDETNWDETETPDPIIVERITPIAMVGQLKPIEPPNLSETDGGSPTERVERANAASAIQPDSDRFVNAIQIYPYTAGALYQVYTAPEQVTDIALQPGEELISVSAGDTVRWVLGDTVSGSGERQQVHILVKPIDHGLATNLIITTSKRTYHIEMTSFRKTYMAAVSWRYPHEALIRHHAASKLTTSSRQTPKAEQTGFQVERLNFRYEIEGDMPHWRPLRAFDDGRKVFIQFPARLDQGEAPPLFVIGHDGNSQLVNYRIKGAYYVVDRLFGAAELRLGEEDQQVVRINRITPNRAIRSSL